MSSIFGYDRPEVRRDLNLLRRLRFTNASKFRQILNMHLTFTNLELNAEQLEFLWRFDDRNYSNVGRKSGDFCEKSVFSDDTFFSPSKSNGDIFTDGAHSGRRSLVAVIREKLTKKKRRVTDEFFNEGVFGAPLTEEGAAAVSQMVQFLALEESAKQEGIFRKSGSPLRQAVLKKLLDRSDTIEFRGKNTEFSVHDVASTLKTFLRELPQPIFTDAHYPIYALLAEWAVGIENLSKSERCALINRQIKVVRLLMLLLPDVVVDVLSQLLHLLQIVVSHKENNKMDEANLGTIFTPLLFLPRQTGAAEMRDRADKLSGLLATIILRADDIFQVPREVVRDVASYFRTYQRGPSAGGGDVLSDSSRRISQNLNNNDESVDLAVTDVAFVNQERSAMDNEKINTETQLAALYAHVQMMPDGPEKTKRLKQFQQYNRKNCTSTTNSTFSVGRATRSIKSRLLNQHKKQTDIQGDPKQRRSLSSLSGSSSTHHIDSTTSTDFSSYTSATTIFSATSSCSTLASSFGDADKKIFTMDKRGAATRLSFFRRTTRARSIESILPRSKNDSSISDASTINVSQYDNVSLVSTVKKSPLKRRRMNL